MPISAGPDTQIAQYFESEALVDSVTSVTINPAGELLVATPVGQNDQRIPPSQLAVVLAGVGLSGSSGSIALDVASLPTAATSADSDWVVIRSISGSEEKIAKDDFLSGVVGTTDLGNTPSINSVQITSSSGNPTTLAQAGTGQAGVLSGPQFDTFSAKLDSVDLVGTGDAVSVTITNTAGLDASLPVATALACGVLTAADWARFDAAAGAGVDLALGNRTDTALEITNTAGDNVTLPEASSSPGGAGLLSTPDKALIENAIIHTGAITSNTSGVTTLSPLTVDNTHMQSASITVANNALDDLVVVEDKIGALAVTTGKLGANAATFAKVQQIAGNTLLGNATPTPADVIDFTSLPMGSADPSANLVGWDTGGNLVQFQMADVQSQTARKFLYDDLGTAGATLTIDLQALTGDNKKVQITDDTVFTLSNGVEGRYKLKIKQDATGGRSPSLVVPGEPDFPLQVDLRPNRISTIVIEWNDDGTFSW